MFGMRLGSDPRTVVTGTPTPTPVIRDLFERAKQPGSGVVMTGGPTDDNLANLAPSFRRIIEGYRDTRLGRQELYAELLMDVEGALWTNLLIERYRVKPEAVPDLTRIVVAVDPAITADKSSNETGIVAVGIADGPGGLSHGYVLDDASGVFTPGEWAQAVVNMYRGVNADYVVAEGNQGGDMVRFTIQSADRNVQVRIVHASRGKYTRAEPVAALYEQGRVHHVGLLPKLEDQMTSWVPGKVSPDRMDALVHGLTQLMVSGKSRALITQ
jgi:phage terminase large subunit-like protein